MRAPGMLRAKYGIALVAAAAALAACGGGGSVAAEGVGSGGTGFISGMAIKGPLNNATVTAYAVSNGQRGIAIASAQTDAAGRFTLAIGSYAGPVLLLSGGGTFTDEASGTLLTMGAGDVLTAVLPDVGTGSGGSGIQLTPLTAMAQAMAQGMAGGMTQANITAANTALANHFAVQDILHIHPMDPLQTGSAASASQESQNYGMALAAMSEYALVIGVSNPSALVTALMSDASDGVLDGKSNLVSVPLVGSGISTLPAAAGTSGLAGAMNSFMNSGRNKSTGLTAALVGKLNASNGRL